MLYTANLADPMIRIRLLRARSLVLAVASQAAEDRLAVTTGLQRYRQR